MAAISREILKRRGILRSRVMATIGARSMASWFGHVEPAAKDPILGVTEAFLADPSPDKVNVGVVCPLFPSFPVFDLVALSPFCW